VKFLIKENKLIGVIQKVINSELNRLKNLEESGIEIPDDISDGTWEDIQTVTKITVSDIIESKFKITPEIYYTVIVDITYDSVSGIAIDDIIYDLQNHVKKTLGIPYIMFKIGEERNLYKEYGQW
jgi:hypothetical protein